MRGRPGRTEPFRNVRKASASRDFDHDPSSRPLILARDGRMRVVLYALCLVTASAACASSFPTASANPVAAKLMSGGWFRYVAEECPFAAEVPGPVAVRVTDMSFSRTWDHVANYSTHDGRNSLGVRCIKFSSTEAADRERDDGSLLSLGGWDIRDTTVVLTRVTVDGINAIRLSRTFPNEPRITLHRLFVMIGRYHYRLDYNERFDAESDVERFFRSFRATVPDSRGL